MNTDKRIVRVSESVQSRDSHDQRSYTPPIPLSSNSIEIGNFLEHNQVQEQLKLLKEEVEKLKQSATKVSDEPMFTWENIPCFDPAKKKTSL